MPERCGRTQLRDSQRYLWNCNAWKKCLFIVLATLLVRGQNCSTFKSILTREDSFCFTVSHKDTLTSHHQFDHLLIYSLVTCIVGPKQYFHHLYSWKIEFKNWFASPHLLFSYIWAEETFEWQKLIFTNFRVDEYIKYNTIPVLMPLTIMLQQYTHYGSVSSNPYHW